MENEQIIRIFARLLIITTTPTKIKQNKRIANGVKMMASTLVLAKPKKPLKKHGDVN